MRFRADTWLSTIYSYLLEGAPCYTVEVLFSQCTYTVQNEAGGRPVEGGLARHGPAVCTGQLPAHPRGFTSYQEALDFVNGLDVQALDPFAL